MRGPSNVVYMTQYCLKWRILMFKIIIVISDDDVDF